MDLWTRVVFTSRDVVILLKWWKLSAKQASLALSCSVWQVGRVAIGNSFVYIFCGKSSYLVLFFIGVINVCYASGRLA